MNMPNTVKNFIALIFLLNSFVFHSQKSSMTKHYYQWFDANVGYGNTGLYNGISYKEKYRTLKGNFKFYKSPEFQVGDLVYEGQPYFDIEMKYDIYDDQLIVKLPSQSGFNFIQLAKEEILRFNFGRNIFVKSPKRSDTATNSFVFYEELFKSAVFTLYKDYSKIRNRRFLDKGFRYNIFKDKNTYYLYYEDDLFPIRSKRDLMKLFPELKKYISNYYNTNKILSEVNFDSFITVLAKGMSEKIQPNTIKK